MISNISDRKDTSFLSIDIASFCEDDNFSENADTSLKCSETPMYKGDSASEVLPKDLT